MSPADKKAKGDIHFISVYGPRTKNHAALNRSAIQSHAARISHGRVRRARITEFQAKNTATTRGSLYPLAQDTESTETAPIARNRSNDRLYQSEVAAGAVGTQEEDVPGWGLVPGGLGSGRRDLFMSFVRPLKPIEHFLLDYCKYDNVPACVHRFWWGPFLQCLGERKTGRPCYEITNLVSQI